MLVYLNGKIVPKEQAVVSVYDHGFLYGDGIFEGIRVYGGNIFRLDAHVVRLYDSAKAIGLEVPLSPAQMSRAVVETVAANGRPDIYVRLVVSRGPGDLGIDPAKCRSGPSIVIIVDAIALYPDEVYEKGLALVTSSVRRVPMDSLDPRVKSLNYLNNIMAKIEARNAGCSEAVMLNHAGRVAECTADNIFVVKNGTLKTPPLTEGALGGITRAAVLELAAAAGMPATEALLGLTDLYTADECFLTGTGAELVPVTSVDGRRIGAGSAGPVSKRLLVDFRRLRETDGTKVSFTAAMNT
jgi:branched-chain amino acid aminotransferase